MFERFTHAARTAVVHAQQEARDRGAPSIGVEHLLLGVLRDAEGAPAVVLARYGIDLDGMVGVSRDATDLDDEALTALGIDVGEVRRRTEEAFGVGALDRAAGSSRGVRATKGHLPFTAGAKAALSQAVRSAAFHRDHEISSAQLFLGLLTDESVVLTLRRLGVKASTEELISLIRECVQQAA